MLIKSCEAHTSFLLSVASRVQKGVLDVTLLSPNSGMVLELDVDEFWENKIGFG